MIPWKLLFTFFEVSLAVAQTALPDPITAFSVHTTNTNSKTGKRWDTWQADFSFSIQEAVIRSGDYFDFSLSGQWVQEPLAPIDYDFYIVDDKDNQLFHQPTEPSPRSFSIFLMLIPSPFRVNSAWSSTFSTSTHSKLIQSSSRATP